MVRVKALQQAGVGRSLEESHSPGDGSRRRGASLTQHRDRDSATDPASAHISVRLEEAAYGSMLPTVQYRAAIPATSNRERSAPKVDNLRQRSHGPVLTHSTDIWFLKVAPALTLADK